MTDQSRTPDRLKEHARKMRSFLDELDVIDSVTSDSGNDPFRLPYATKPKIPSRKFKLTLHA